jgi:hypothetical protein
MLSILDLRIGYFPGAKLTAYRELPLECRYSRFLLLGIRYNKPEVFSRGVCRIGLVLA